MYSTAIKNEINWNQMECNQNASAGMSSWLELGLPTEWSSTGKPWDRSSTLASLLSSLSITIILILKSSPMLKNLHKLCYCRLSMCGSTSSPRTLLSRQTSPVFLTLRVSAGRLVGMVTILLMSVLVLSGIFWGNLRELFWYFMEMNGWVIQE